MDAVAVRRRATAVNKLKVLYSAAGGAPCTNLSLSLFLA